MTKLKGSAVRGVRYHQRSHNLDAVARTTAENPIKVRTERAPLGFYWVRTRAGCDGTCIEGIYPSEGGLQCQALCQGRLAWELYLQAGLHRPDGPACEPPRFRHTCF